MLLNLEESTAESFEYDICIVGSGIAGSIISKEINNLNKNLRVCILERGTYKKNNFHQNFLKKLIYEKLNIKENSREFIVGGSSSTWGGVSTHYTQFEMLNIDNQSNIWPIDYNELVYFYRQASKKYNFYNTYDFKDSSFNIFNKFELRYFFSNYPPLNFKTFIDTFHHDLILNANIVSLEQVGNDIEYLIASTNNNKKAKIYAKYFVFSCGTLETIKLLLNNLKKNNLRLGKEKDNIGLYFMNHPKCISGRVKLFKSNKEINRFIPTSSKVGSGYWGLSLPKTYNKDYLNSYIRFSFDKPLIYKSIFKPFIKSIFTFISNPLNFKINNSSSYDLPKQLLESDYKEFFKKEKNNYKDLLFKSVLKCPLKSLEFFRKLFLNKDLKVHNYLEMKPNRRNKVYLNSKKDIFQNYLLTIDYDLSEEDFSSINLLHKKIKEVLIDNNIGLLESIPFENLPRNIFNDSSHHLGGLIMGSNPNNSVVDANLKLHSLNNIYLISGGVFPTSGSGNPTWTLGALSIRLAKKLMEVINS